MLLRAILTAWCLLAMAVPAAAGNSIANRIFDPSGDRLNLQLASYVHYSSSDKHAGVPIYGGIEVRKPSDWLYGLGLFNNSYDQFSQYLYVGHRFDLYRFGGYQLHLKLSVGAVHGYHGEHEDSLPLRVGDIGAAIIPALGLHAGRWSADLVFLVDQAVMFNIGFDLND